MEGIQILKHCDWISDEINVKEYFDQYKTLLQSEGNNGRPFYKQSDHDNAIMEMFQTDDDLIDPDTKTPTSDVVTSSRKVKRLKVSGSSRDTTPSTLSEPREPLSLEEMKKRCSIDLLKVHGELPPRKTPTSHSLGGIGRLTNWFTGSFSDGIIPEHGPQYLKTLAHQAIELYDRETKPHLATMRNKTLKYSSTVRLAMKDQNIPEDLPENSSDSCLDEIVFNIRVYRPYHKRTYSKKGWHQFPKYSEEFLVLGSQNLASLRDLITCINDHYIHKDFSDNPDPSLVNESDHMKMENQFPSSFIYINGTFYVDTRNGLATDTSERIREWARDKANYDPVNVKPMHEINLIDLKLRVGYPYLYQHLGNCEHLVTFTDISLHSRRDIQDPTKFPLLRGNPIKVSMKCYACALYLAVWVVKDNDSALMPTPCEHYCHGCLKKLFYDDDERKIGNFEVYPFMDEFAAKKRKMENSKAVSVVVRDGKIDISYKLR